MEMGGWCCAKVTVLRLLVVCVWFVGGAGLAISDPGRTVVVMAEKNSFR